MLIESPVLDEVKEILKERDTAEGNKEGITEGEKEGKKEGEKEGIRDAVAAALGARFGAVRPEHLAALATVADIARLKALHRFAITCPDLEAFAAELASCR